ncbi:MAG TPA: hypothetical protein VG942_02770 [Hyphomonadaceae bacterium]|nr:hypothetical protein [Hyphomonadaceae bacterium]
MTQARSTAHTLGPYVLAFLAGAIALSRNEKPGEAARVQADENAKARSAIVDKLVDRLALLYRTRRMPRRRFS